MIDVLGVPIFSGQLPEAATVLITKVGKGNRESSLLVSATGAHGIVYSKKHRSFGILLKRFFMNLPDGMPVVWIGRLKGARTMQRCYGPSFFEFVMRRSAGKTIQHFFCGGKDGVAEELKSVCSKVFENHNIVGTFTPPFRDMTDIEMSVLARKISEVGANVVWIGLSTPKQELFAARLAEYVTVDFIVTVGAAFDFHTGRVRQAPRWVQRSGLEWIFRLLMEPKRLYKRYIEIVPLFLYYGCIDLVSFWWNKQESR